MCGLPCSGKTTLAKELAHEHRAVRLTPDEWHTRLFGQDADSPEHDARHGVVESLQWEVAAQVLAQDIDVILDFGFWNKSERADYRSRAAVIGAGTRIHFLDVSEDVLFRRLEASNDALPTGSFRISPELMREFLGFFEAPTRLELDEP